MYRGSNHGPWAFSCVPPARSLGEILARFCGFSRCYGQENFPSVFLALTSPVAHAEGTGAMMRSCSTRPRHRASAIAECVRGVQTAEGRRRFQFCIERFQSVGRPFFPFLQLGNLVTFNLVTFNFGHSRSSRSERTVSRAAVYQMLWLRGF